LVLIDGIGKKRSTSDKNLSTECGGGMLLADCESLRKNKLTKKRRQVKMRLKPANFTKIK
jgi:hypothetical protein